MFSPLLLKKGVMIDGTQGQVLGRVPCVQEERLKAGSHGTVFRVTLAGNPFGIASGGRTVCARKDYDIANPRTFEAEWKHAQLLCTSQRLNENVLEIFTGLRTPTSLSFFCELADSDLQDFMETAEPPDSLVNLERRLIQFIGLVLAVEFLSVRDMSTAARIGDGNTCLAPEAYGDEGKVNASNDVWHLGCVLCMFVAWLHRGPKGLSDFNNHRYSEQQRADWFFFILEQYTPPEGVNEKEYCRKESTGRFLISTFSLKVAQWLKQLPELTKGRPGAFVYAKLAHVLETDMLVADPQKRQKIENVRLRVESVLTEISSSQKRKDIPPKIQATGSSNIPSRSGRKK